MTQFEHIEGMKVHGLWGCASDSEPVITISHGMRGKVLANTIYHELGHKLFPSRPHWWVDLYGMIMAKGGGGGIYSAKYHKTAADMPSREQLLKLSRRASLKFNQENS
jgi:hypothetical protein